MKVLPAAKDKDEDDDDNDDGEDNRKQHFSYPTRPSTTSQIPAVVQTSTQIVTVVDNGRSLFFFYSQILTTKILRKNL